MKYPKVSIIIPTHNGMDNIERTVSSALAQNYNNLEVIVVDDNGEGTEKQIETETILAKFKNDNRFRYHAHNINRNGSAARNTGAKYATGEYLNFLDDDDELGPEKISYQVHLLKDLAEGWAGSYSSTVIQMSGKIIRRINAIKSGDLLLEHLNSIVRIGTPSLLLKKDVWEAIGGYDESFSRHQDWEFNARILDKYKLVAARNAYYIRNYTFRHNEKDIRKQERDLVHYTNVMRDKLESVPKKKLESALRRKFITILLGYLKSGNIKDFYRVWNEQDFKISDICSVLGYVFHYLKNRITYGKAF